MASQGHLVIRNYCLICFFFPIVKSYQGKKKHLLELGGEILGTSQWQRQSLHCYTWDKKEHTAFPEVRGEENEQKKVSD